MLKLSSKEASILALLACMGEATNTDIVKQALDALTGSDAQQVADYLMGNHDISNTAVSRYAEGLKKWAAEMGVREAKRKTAREAKRKARHADSD